MGNVERAQAYFACVRARDPAGVAAMFAETGRLNMPNGEHLVGRRAIEDYYKSVFAQTSPNPKVLAVAADGPKCLVELLAHRPDGQAAQVADVFTFDDAGEVLELTIYMRSGLVRPAAG
jgi:hypothetical protein